MNVLYIYQLPNVNIFLLDEQMQLMANPLFS